MPRDSPVVDESASQEIARLRERVRHLEAELEASTAIQRTALEQAPVGLVVADAGDMRIRLASLAGLGILGKARRPLRDITRAEHLQGWRMLRPDGRPFPPDERPLERAVQRGETTEAMPAIILADDGQRRHVLINAAPVRAENGDVIAGVAVFLDVTAQRELEEERAQTLTFFAHDMKSPLLGAAALVRALLQGRDGPLSPRQEDRLVMVEELLERVLSLSIDFLDLARMEQPGFQLALDEVPTTPLLEALAGEYGARARDKGLRFQADLPHDLPALAGDARRLARMIANLLDNAIKYTADGEVRLLARALEGEVEIQVLDTGPGLSPNDLSHCFDSFFRGDAGVGAEGTGVGLAAVKAIAQAHGGCVRVANRQDHEHGAVFLVRLPVPPDAAACP